MSPMRSFRMARPVLWFAVGALLGPWLDRMHVREGIVRYTRPLVFRPWLINQAWWVPLLFGIATLLFTSLLSRSFWTSSVRRPLLSDMSLADAWFCRLVALLWFWSSYRLTACPTLNSSRPRRLLLGISLIVSNLLLDPTPSIRTNRIAWIVAIGLVAEWWLSQVMRVFVHRYSNDIPLLRLPYWLPGLYLSAIPFLASLRRPLLLFR